MISSAVYDSLYLLEIIVSFGNIFPSAGEGHSQVKSISPIYKGSYSKRYEKAW